MDWNLSDAVYGTIAVAALLSAESARRETYPGTVAAVVITLLLYWLAHAYSELAGERLRSGERLTFSSLGRTLAAQLTLLAGAAVPLIELLIWWAAGGSLETAVTAGVWTSAAMIAILEIAIGIRTHLRGRELAAQIAIGALLGLLVVALRVILH